MNIKNISHEMNLQKWSQKVKECRSSGQTASKWCAEKNINIKNVTLVQCLAHSRRKFDEALTCLKEKE